MNHFNCKGVTADCQSAVPTTLNDAEKSACPDADRELSTGHIQPAWRTAEKSACPDADREFPTGYIWFLVAGSWFLVSVGEVFGITHPMT
jgi:hypothetical protein